MTTASSNDSPPPGAGLPPLVLAVLAAFLVVGAAIPVLPLHVTGTLGMTAFVVGLVSGAQFAASLVSRFWSGRYADRHGGRRALLVGLAVCAAAGLLYVASVAAVGRPGASLALLLCGRAVLGAGESFVITGALSWGVASAGAGRTGRVMSWVGTAMYVGFALGGPLGAALYARDGFLVIALATIVVPACAWLAVVRLRGPGPADVAGRDASERNVLRVVWLPGLALAFSSVGFGTLTTFAPLLLAQQRWGDPWTAFTAFSTAFVLARVLLGHLPDRFGGARVALVCVVVEGAGQWLVWQAAGLPAMLGGATLTGLGYALVYPALGVEAVRRAPAPQRALAMGAYTAFLDLMLGLASPLLGLLAGHAGVQAVFAAGAASAGCAAVAAAWLGVDARRREAARAAA